MSSAEGIPLAVILSAANEHDVNFILPLVYTSLPRIGGLSGRPREFPSMVRADCGYTTKDVLTVFEVSGIEAEIPQRRKDSEAGLGNGGGRSSDASHASNSTVVLGRDVIELRIPTIRL